MGDDEKYLFTILPPEDHEFRNCSLHELRNCSLCGNPMCYNGTSNICIWCEIHKEEEK